MIGKKVVHHMMMSEKDAHYVGGLVNGARIVVQWGDVGTELMVYADGDISLFLGYEKIEFTAPVYVGDFMEYVGWIEEVGNQSYKCKFEAWKVATMLDRTDADMEESSIQRQQHVNHQFFAQQEQEVYILRRKTREDHRKNHSKT